MDRILIFLRKYSEKRLNIPKQKGWNNKYVNKLHKWETGLLFFLYSGYNYMLFSFESSIHGFSTFSVLITLYSFESYMEWKYDRESKEF